MLEKIKKLLSIVDSAQINLFLAQIAEDELNGLYETLEILLATTRDVEVITALVARPLIERAQIEDDQLSAEVNNLLTGVKQLAFVHNLETEQISNPGRHLESLRKMLLSIARDIRVVFIILADQLYIMRHLDNLNQQQQAATAEETRQIFAPLANRLGMWAIKWELEDLAFRYLQPTDYKQLATKLAEKREERESYIKRIQHILTTELAQAGIKAQVTGRPKHIYSIFRKMQRKGLGFDELYDLRAVRVLTASQEECYNVLGIVHNLYKPIPKEFDDYISHPKGNNYQSLHTAVRALDNKIIEVQIRTFKMHEFAESGIAAHWRYKENTKYDAVFENKIKWLRQLLDWQEDVTETSLGDFSDTLAEEFIYMFTPGGEVIELPEGATALDFAYKIHSEIGHKTRGAKADGKIIPLTSPLATGQQIEILTAKEGAPSRDWMNPNHGYLKTSSARAKVKNWFRRFNYEENVSSGQTILSKESKRLQVSPKMETLTKKFRCQSENDLLAKIGLGEISAIQLALAFQAEISQNEPLIKKTIALGRQDNKSDFVISGVGNMLTTIATCCNPLPGDVIIGFITQGRGVSIHRQDCRNILHLASVQKERIIEVSWGNEQQKSYQINVMIEAYHRAELIKDITTLLSFEKIPVLALNTQETDKQEINKISLTVEVESLAQLARCLDRIEQIKNVVGAYRY